MAKQKVKSKKKKAKGKAKAEPIVVEGPKPRPSTQAKLANITAEDIINARDVKGLSWRDVGTTLGLGGSTSARRAYRILTGKSPKESVTNVRRAPRRKDHAVNPNLYHPEWTVDTDQQEIVERISGHTIYVERRTTRGEIIPEEIEVARVRKFDYQDLERPAVEFVEGHYLFDSKTGEKYIDRKRCTGAIRTVFLDTIKEVR